MGYANKKGADGEREIVKLFQNFFPAYKESIYRTAHPEAMKFSYNGDVTCFDKNCILSEYAHEVKRHEQESPRRWFEKLVDDINDGEQRPLVHFRPNNKEYLTLIKTEDFLRILYDLQRWRDDFEEQQK